MDSEQKFWLILWGMIITGITVMIVTATICYNDRVKTAFEKGYIEDVVKGGATTLWVKSQSNEGGK